MNYNPRTPYGRLSGIIKSRAKCSDERHDLIVAIIERTALDAAGFTSPLGHQDSEAIQNDALGCIGGHWFAQLCGVVGLDPKRVAAWSRQSSSIRNMEARGGMRTHTDTRAWGEALVAEDDPFGEALVEIADAWALDRELRGTEVAKDIIEGLGNALAYDSDGNKQGKAGAGANSDALARAAQMVYAYGNKL